MSYARQDSAMRRMQAEGLKNLDALAGARRALLAGTWQDAKSVLEMDIMRAYRSAAPSGNWSLPAMQRSLPAMVYLLTLTLSRLQDRARAAMSDAFDDAYQLANRRACWALDQVTPESIHVKCSSKAGMHEAEMTPPQWEERWNEWVAGYKEALVRNLRMNALNEGSMQDAMAEVSATRVNTPAYTLELALERLFDTEFYASVAGGMHQAVEDNQDLVEEEIWRTRGDLRVCDDCDANEGRTAEEADGDIPLHPHCHCFWQVVPREYAELLRSGDEADRELARQMDYEGVVPNALVIRGPNGDIAGKATVDFEQWAGEQDVPAVRGGV